MAADIAATDAARDMAPDVAVDVAAKNGADIAAKNATDVANKAADVARDIAAKNAADVAADIVAKNATDVAADSAASKAADTSRGMAADIATNKAADIAANNPADVAADIATNKAAHAARDMAADAARDMAADVVAEIATTRATEDGAPDGTAEAAALFDHLDPLVVAPDDDVDDAVTSDAQTWQPQIPKAPTATSTVPWRRPYLATTSTARPVPSLVIDDADPESAAQVLEDREAERVVHRRSFLPPILLDREDRSARQGGLTLAVIILLIAATLTLSYLMRRPSSSGDGVTLGDRETQLLG